MSTKKSLSHGNQFSNFFSQLTVIHKFPISIAIFFMHGIIWLGTVPLRWWKGVAIVKSEKNK